MTITLNADYDVALSTALLGYVGETNARPVTVEGMEVDGADRYVLTIDYGDGVTYEVDITGGIWTPTADILRSAQTVSCQIAAKKLSGQEYILLKKSRIFRLRIGAAIGDNAVPSPDVAMDALDKIDAIGRQAHADMQTAVTAAETATTASENAAKSATDAGVSADTAMQAAKRAETAQTVAETSATQADASRQGADTARQQAVTQANAAKISADLAASAAQQTTADKTATAGYAQTTKTNADSAATDRQTVQEMATQVTADKATVADNAAQVAADRKATENAAQTALKSAESVNQLKEDLGDIRKVSPNIFEKEKAISGKRVGSSYGQYTDWGSRSVYSITFDSIITKNCNILFNQKPEEIAYYKEKNGVYERLGGYTTPQEDENGNYYYQISGITSTRWLSAIEISYTTKTTNVDTFMMCIDSLPDGYIPFGIYLESFEKRVATEKDISELKENKVITDTVTGFGVGALAEESDSKYNVAVGVNALKMAKHTEENDTGYYNVAVGHNALPLLETGSHNTAIGFQALNKNTKGHYNTACGEDALFNTTGSNNTGCGCRALQNNTTGTNNTALGGALYNCSTGYMNNAIGNGAGNSITSDTRCNFFGREADKDTSDIINNSMALGHSAKVTKSNQVVIGNASVEEFVLGNKRIVFNSDGTVTWESLS